MNEKESNAKKRVYELLKSLISSEIYENNNTVDFIDSNLFRDYTKQIVIDTDSVEITIHFEAKQYA